MNSTPDVSFFRRVSTRRWSSAACLSACLLTAGLGLQHLRQSEAQAQPAAVASVSLDRIESLAMDGDFEALKEQLREYGPADDATAQRLLSRLDTFTANADTRAEEQLRHKAKAMKLLRIWLTHEELESALVAAIDAHSLASDPDTWLTSPEVTELVELSEIAAESAEDQGDWLQAISLYRLMDLLFEVDAQFSDRLDRSLEHIRVLQMYAPEHYEAMAEARRAELSNGNDDDTLVLTEPERWEDRLEGINGTVLVQALRDSASHHYRSPDYASMLAGGVEQLQVLLNSPEAAESFPGLDDEAATDRFVGFLSNLHQQLTQPGARINLPETRDHINRIRSTNDLTVRLPSNVLYYELTEGSTDTIDAFSYVIWPVDTAEFLERTMQGRFYGVGIQIARENGQLTVISPLANTPAQRAGIRAGDIIATVDGRSTSTWSLTRAVREITGEEGTEVELGIQRVGQDELIDVTLQRAEIPIDSIRGWQHTPDGDWDYWIDQEAGLAYIRLSQFVEQTVPDLDAAIAQLQAEQEINGLILDLRFNPGGLMDAAVGVVDRFISEGPIVATADANGRRTPGSTRGATRGPTLPDFPVVILINEGSASASEIVAGALQDYNRATIVGERSYGKGSVQQVYWYPNQFAIRWGVKVTTSYYTLPDGQIIHKEEDSETWGIEPDLSVPMTERQVASSIEYRREADVIREPDEEPTPAEAILTDGLDAQLEAALVVLESQLLVRRLELANADR